MTFPPDVMTAANKHVDGMGSPGPGLRWVVRAEAELTDAWLFSYGVEPVPADEDMPMGAFGCAVLKVDLSVVSLAAGRWGAAKHARTVAVAEDQADPFGDLLG